jgi:hypothetical protein
MAHYVVTLGDQTHTISAWSEQEAIGDILNKLASRPTKLGTVAADWDAWSDKYDALASDVSVRPATVREALVSAYGEDFAGKSNAYDVTKRTWFTYGNDGPAYETGYQPRQHIWHEADIIVINYTKGRDIYGYEEPVEVANYRVLKENWSELEGLSDGPYSNCSVIALDLDSEAPSDLIDVLNGLENYPVIDEQEWSRVEQEMIQEHWESYGKRDTVSAVEKALGLDETGEMLSDNAESIIDELTFSGMLGDFGNGSEYPSMIDVSACEFGSEIVTKFIADNLGEVTTIEYYGRTMTVDLTRENLIA